MNKGDNSQYTIINLEGDLSRSDRLADVNDTLADTIKNSKNVALDIQNLDFATGDFVGMLMGYHTILKKEGGSLSLIGGVKEMKDLFDLTHINRVIHIYETSDSFIKGRPYNRVQVERVNR